MIVGGIKSIGAVASRIVPFMCIAYVVAAIYILLVNAAAIPGRLLKIVTEAFIAAGGVRRFSGRPGDRHPASRVQQRSGRRLGRHRSLGGQNRRTGQRRNRRPAGALYRYGRRLHDHGVGRRGHRRLRRTRDGSRRSPTAREPKSRCLPSSTAGTIGSATSCTSPSYLFAYSTCISWSYYGERCWVELFGARTSMVYKVLFLVFTVLGSIVTRGNILAFSDLMILGMSFPNLLGVFLLSGIVKRQLDRYWASTRAAKSCRADQV